MEYTTISTKLPVDEATKFRAFSEKKGLSPSMLLRELVAREVEAPMSKLVAGRNKIAYDRETDTFSWSIALDVGDENCIVEGAPEEFVRDLHKMLGLAIEERKAVLGQGSENSVPIPSKITRRKKK